MSTNQKKFLRKTNGQGWVGLLITSVLSLGFAWFIFSLIYPVIVFEFQQTNHSLGNIITIVPMIFVAIAPVILLRLIWVSVLQQQADLRDGSVNMIQGLTAVETQSGQVIVNGVKLTTINNGILFIKHLEPHIVYYLPRSKVVVSVEVIEA